MSDDDRRVIAKTEMLVPATSEPKGPPAPLDVQTIIDRLRAAGTAPYVTVEHVAKGGMGSIDRVDDVRLGRSCALKRIHTNLADDARSVALFVREAQITGQLEHPNIVPVYELDEVGGQIRFTMKLVDGRTLRELVEQFPPGALGRGALYDLLEIVLKVCDALAYAHSRGVLHCDIKPANIMVGEFGQVYLMDWGVARMMGEEIVPTVRESRSKVRDPFNTATATDGIVVGTPSYMAPEQALGGELDHRTDIWAVGALIYTILTRKPPYDAGTPLATLDAARTGVFRPLLAIVEPGDVPYGLQTIVARAMAVDPEHRYSSAAGLRSAIVRFMRGDESFPIHDFDAGVEIVREGEPGDAAYFIRSGRCEVHQTRGGTRKSIRIMGQGEVFGETAILSPGPRTATVTAIEPVSAYRIDAQMLDREVRAAQPWLAAIIGTLAARFRERG